MSGHVARFTCLASLAIFAIADCASAQIQVDSTNPISAPQGTINLEVTINGNGFKPGAVAKCFPSGTTNPGGVTVNSTAFKSSSQISDHRQEVGSTSGAGQVYAHKKN